VRWVGSDFVEGSCEINDAGRGGGWDCDGFVAGLQQGMHISQHRAGVLPRALAIAHLSFWRAVLIRGSSCRQLLFNLLSWRAQTCVTSPSKRFVCILRPTH
jgi:hypothetical protein